MKKATLHRLIDRYFDGDLTPAEERKLRAELLRLSNPDDDECEALAVMSYAGFREKMQKDREGYWNAGKISLRNRRGWISYAAAAVIAAAIVTVGMTLIVNPSVGSDCYAYIGGKRIDDRETVMKLLDSQLNEMKEASEGISNEIESDLGDFRDALESDGIIFESENERI